MKIEWTKEDVARAWVAWRPKTDHRRPSEALDDAMQRVMSEAVSLFLSRASGRVKVDIEALEGMITNADHPQKMRDEARSGLSRLSALANDTAASRAATARAWQEVESIRAMVAELEPHVDRAIHYEAEAKHLRAEVERLKAELQAGVKLWKEHMRQRNVAESRLAAIRERGADDEGLVHGAGAVDRVAQSVARSAARWVLEGDAPQEATWEPNPVLVDIKYRQNGVGEATWRYPCSPACTHDDARTLGHFERVRQTSEAVNRIQRKFKDAEEENVWAAGWDDGLNAGHEKGVDAVRAAVEKWARESFGEVPQTLMAVLDGAV